MRAYFRGAFESGLHMKYRILVLTFALLIGACTAPMVNNTTTSQDTTQTTQPSSTRPSTTDTTVPTGTAATVACDQAPTDFQALCTAYHIVSTSYVDPVDPSSLAAGATQGITDYQNQPGGTAPDSLVCALPDPSFTTFCDAFVEEEQTDPAPVDDLVAAAINGMMNTLDPYSVYFTPEALARFQEETQGQIEGIGALVRAEDPNDPEGATCSTISDSCELVIVSPLEGGPAETVGLKTGDVMTSVNGESIDGWLVDEVISEVRGPAGSTVTIGIDRDGQPLEFTITRAAIDIPIVTSRMVDDATGYLELSVFSTNAPAQFNSALQDLLDQGATNIVLDLQHDPGGSLNTAIYVASEFLSSGLVLRTEAPGDVQEYLVVPGGIATDPSIKLYVLVDQASASASEVVTGAFQDYGRATVVGTHTYGNNTVQQQYNLSNGGAIKMTVARWVTPDGHDYGGVGLTPDVEVEIPTDAPTDYLLNKALELINSGA